MPDVDLLIRGGAPFDIAIADGCIVATGSELELKATKTIDATGLHLLPGAIDAHVHFNDPGRADWEGWATGTAAAAAGGTTCVIDMPLNSDPPTLDAAAFRAKVAAAIGVARCDFALWGGLVPGQVGRLAELAEAGVVGFKAFMCGSGIDEFAAADPETLEAGMLEAARLGLPVAVHAEDPAITERFRLKATGTSWRDFVLTRPIDAELTAIDTAIGLAESTGCSLHVVHVSSAAGVQLVSAAQARGVDVTCETCPHYLVLEEGDLDRLGAVAKCAPPLRPEAEREALRAEVLAGHLTLIASDHSPAPASMKEAGDAFAAWGGISGCQSLLPTVLTEGFSLNLVTSGPADRLRLRGKGRLEVGADADIALVDLADHWTLRTEDLLYRHAHSPYVGRRFHGRVVSTLLRGMPTTGGPAGRLVRPG